MELTTQADIQPGNPRSFFGSNSSLFLTWPYSPLKLMAMQKAHQTYSCGLNEINAGTENFRTTVMLFVGSKRKGIMGGN